MATREAGAQAQPALARALLAAERNARADRFPSLALDTDVDNHAARTRYESFGFQERSTSAARRGLPGFVLYVKELA